MPVCSIWEPAVAAGVDFSDRHNCRQFGINAIMIADTAFYRNKAYHAASDTADRPDYKRTSKIAAAVFEAAQSI